MKWGREQYPLYIGHRRGLKALMSARENLLWSAAINGQGARLAEVDEALRQVSMGSYLDIACGSMSEGQCGRVNLARLVLLNNPVWILDEPFNAIDSDGIQWLLERIKKHLFLGGILVLSSHMEVPLNNLEELELR